LRPRLATGLPFSQQRTRGCACLKTNTSYIGSQPHVILLGGPFPQMDDAPVWLCPALSLMPTLLPRGDELRMNSWRNFLEPRQGSAWRDCIKKGGWALLRYSSMHEKALPNRSLRRPMEVSRASSSGSQTARTTEDLQPTRDPRRHFLRLEERLPVAPASARLS